MPIIGTLSSVNLIAGAGILGNVGGAALLQSNTGLTANINSYTSVAVVNQFANIVSTGFITVNVAANSFPGLTNAIPSAYQSNLGSGTMTAAITSQSSNIMGGGDMGKFEQVFGAAYAYVGTTNELIKSILNANSSSYTTGFINQDNIITGSLSNWTLSFAPLSQDLAQLGLLIDLADLGQLGSPGAVFKQIWSLSGPVPVLSTAMLNAGFSQDTIDLLSSVSLTDRDQLALYNIMTKVTGNDLQQVLKILKVTTPGLTTMADLVNPYLLFPRSYITFTTTTDNGIRAVYIDTNGTVNSLLATELPRNVLAPLNGTPDPKQMTYSQLKKIIPADQALANKAIQVSLQQVKAIFDSTLPHLSVATSTLETNYGLNLINSLTSPLPANVIAFYQTNLAYGSGPNGLLLLTDVIGTPTGWVHDTALTNAVTVLNSMTVEGAFGNLTNGSNGVYTIMQNTANGNYTTGPDMANVYTTTIPLGNPGSGTYVGNTANSSIQSAFDSGLTPNLVANINIIVSNYSNQVSYINTDFNNMANQLIIENNNLASAGVVIANLIAGSQATGLVNNLSSYGLDTNEGGAAYFLESVANLSSQGGQAVISTMRQARNQVRLNDAGIQTDIVVSNQYPEPQATLGQSTYTVSEAASQKII